MAKGWKLESIRHSLSAKGLKSGRKFAPKATVKIAERTQIGDGKLPNRYWVSYGNDFFVCKEGFCDSFGETIKDFKYKGKASKAFKTFKEALDFAYDLPINQEPDLNGINSIFIEDRLSGEVWHQAVYAYTKKTLLGESHAYEIETYDETEYTKKTMKEKGVEFK